MITKARAAQLERGANCNQGSSPTDAKVRALSSADTLRAGRVCAAIKIKPRAISRDGSVALCCVSGRRELGQHSRLIAGTHEWQQWLSPQFAEMGFETARRRLEGRPKLTNT